MVLPIFFNPLEKTAIMHIIKKVYRNNIEERGLILER